ncbi:hypothetical protein [Caballeronia grimmiae]|nr:hypothetical protein [Caballeronia grimmiae]GGD53943.1 hypothetical protein GCM10010985_04580 [Caballeronia grimmiae]
MFSPLIERIDTEGSLRDECIANCDAPVLALVKSMNIRNSSFADESSVPIRCRMQTHQRRQTLTYNGQFPMRVIPPIPITTKTQRRAVARRLLRGDITMQDAALERGVSPVQVRDWLKELGYWEQYDALRKALSDLRRKRTRQARRAMRQMP